MDQRTIQIFFALLRSAICGAQLTDKERALFSPELINPLLKLSSKHDLSHLLVLGLKQNELMPSDGTDLEKYILNALYRYELTRYDYEAICAAFEKSHIPFLPLKGSVIRQYYPEPWMRTSCDIDILIHEEDAETAKSVLVDSCGYTYHKKGSHDFSFFSPSGIHIELHYDLIEDGLINEASAILKSVWDASAPLSGYTYLYVMPDEYYYFYHIAHMAKHFENGGCGIRPFIDLLILDDLDACEEKRSELLVRGKLLRFANVSRKLSGVWFQGEDRDTVSGQMEDYILQGGVYGSEKNRVTIQQQKKGGRIKYALSRMFIPYDIIKYQYPVLQKHKWLTPFMEVCRWFKLIFCGKAARRTLNELKAISSDNSSDTKSFLESIGL